MASLWHRVRSLKRGAGKSHVVSSQNQSSGPPDFIGVGAQRSGTSWWFSLLLGHPGVDHGRIEQQKELHYFDRFVNGEFARNDIAGYHAAFPRSGDLIRGEWTPRYMFDFWVPRLLSLAAPEARLLAMLRDPVERFRSGVAHEEGLYGSEAWMQKLFAGSALARGRYAEQLDRLCDYFPRSQILVLQYERCVANPQAFYDKTLAFLGLPSFQLERSDIDRSVGNLTRRVPPPTGIRDAVVDALRDDARRLASAYPEIDLSLWPDFALG